MLSKQKFKIVHTVAKILVKKHFKKMLLNIKKFCWVLILTNSLILSCNYKQLYHGHPWPVGKSKFNLKSDRVNLVAPALVLLSVCFIYPMSGRYSTNWDRKGWPGSEIQMYYGCPWYRIIKPLLLNFVLEV